VCLQVASMRHDYGVPQHPATRAGAASGARSAGTTAATRQNTVPRRSGPASQAPHRPRMRSRNPMRPDAGLTPRERRRRHARPQRLDLVRVAKRCTHDDRLDAVRLMVPVDVPHGADPGIVAGGEVLSTRCLVPAFSGAG
jgi:hypothetical protein